MAIVWGCTQRTVPAQQCGQSPSAGSWSAGSWAQGPAVIHSELQARPHTTEIPAKGKVLSSPPFSLFLSVSGVVCLPGSARGQFLELCPAKEHKHYRKKLCQCNEIQVNPGELRS